MPTDRREPEGHGLLGAVIHASVRRRGLVVLATAMAAMVGVASFLRLPIDAVPDITNIQVQINTAAPGYSPLEVEQQVTFPVENALAGIPNLDYTRSLSRYALSQVTAVFEDGTDIYQARQLVAERLADAAGDLPESIEPEMGPIATGLGEIFLYAVTAEEGAVGEDGEPIDGADLRSAQDWIIKPQLRTVRGVTEVNSLGGDVRQFVVEPDPKRLVLHGLTMHDVIDGLRRANLASGAAFVERGGELILVRAEGRLSTVEDLRRVVIDAHDGTLHFVEDVADVRVGGELRTGAATRGGREIVLGTVFMLMGENSRRVAHAAGEKVEAIRAALPRGIRLDVLYDRTTLVDRTIDTVRENLTWGALLVIAVLVLLLGNLRAALITAMVIPLAMLITVTGMVAFGISGNLMSLGALDFGLIVDGAVIIVENCVRRLSAAPVADGAAVSAAGTRAERVRLVADAAVEVVRPSFFGVAVIMVVYVPVLTLRGVEGKMFVPMATTVVMALAAASVLSVTFVPAAVALLLRGRVSERRNPIVEGLRALYRPVLGLALRLRWGVLAAAAVWTVVALWPLGSMGREFVPTLDEGDLAIHSLRIPSTNLTESIDMQHRVEARLRELPEVRDTFSKLGTAEIATDPMPPGVVDGFVMLHEPADWPDPARPKADLLREIDEALHEVPGSRYEILQPIQMRFNELLAGVRADVAVKVFGDDFAMLESLAAEVAAVLQGIDGAADVAVEQTTGLPVRTVHPDRDAMSRYGLAVADVHEEVVTALAGRTAGAIYEGDQRYDVVVRLGEDLRHSEDALLGLPIPIAHRDTHGSEDHPPAPYVPLRVVADVVTEQGANQFSRENGKRRVVVTANVRGRDLGSFVTEAREKVAAAVIVPSAYWLEWGGQFENLESATRRLQVVVPAALLLLFVLLVMALGSGLDAAVVASGVPLAWTGGALALQVQRIPLSISAVIGFIALSGIAVLNGLVMLTVIRQMRDRGVSCDEAVLEGSVVRLRPVLMTALVASLGFIPMALATGTGAEVQRPLATVVVGGIVSSTLLTLVVLPALYRSLEKVRRALV